MASHHTRTKSKLRAIKDSLREEHIAHLELLRLHRFCQSFTKSKPVVISAVLPSMMLAEQYFS